MNDRAQRGMDAAAFAAMLYFPKLSEPILSMQRDGADLFVTGPSGRRKGFLLTFPELENWDHLPGKPKGFLGAYAWATQGMPLDEDDVMSDPNLLVDALHA